MLTFTLKCENNY